MSQSRRSASYGLPDATALVKLLAGIELVIGVILLRTAVAAVARTDTAISIVGGPHDTRSGGLAWIGALLGLAAVGHIVGALGLWNHNSYARRALLVFAAGWLLVFPVGTVLGIVTIAAASLESFSSLFIERKALGEFVNGQARVIKGGIIVASTIAIAILGAFLCSGLRRSTTLGDQRTAAESLRFIWSAQEQHKVASGGYYALSLESLSQPCSQQQPYLPADLLKGMERHSGYRLGLGPGESRPQAKDCLGRPLALDYRAVAVPVDPLATKGRTLFLTGAGIVSDQPLPESSAK